VKGRKEKVKNIEQYVGQLFIKVSYRDIASKGSEVNNNCLDSICLETSDSILLSEKKYKKKRGKSRRRLLFIPHAISLLKS
jgi:hypothetical protein